MNMLTVAAAYGILVAVFQWGWLDWTGYNSPGYIDTIVPALVLAVMFGLSMDYEVFLLTRIKERWIALGDSDARGVRRRCCWRPDHLERRADHGRRLLRLRDRRADELRSSASASRPPSRSTRRSCGS